MGNRSETLFLALTRPALWWGVPTEAAVLNIMFFLFVGFEFQAPTLWRSPMMFWVLFLPVHYCILQPLTAWDYHWTRTVRLWALTISRPILVNIPTRSSKNSKKVPSSV